MNDPIEPTMPRGLERARWTFRRSLNVDSQATLDITSGRALTAGDRVPSPVSPLFPPTNLTTSRHSPESGRFSFELTPKDPNIVKETALPTRVATDNTLEDAPLVQRTPTNDHRGLYSLTPISILGFLLLGIVFAAAHHLYYASLAGRDIQEINQELAVRIGTGLAFINRAFLVASAAMAYQQHYWTVLRARAMSVKSIDKIMALLSDPTCFSSLELLRKNWSCTIIALLIWCIPLSSIVPPATLTVTVATPQQSLIEDVPIVDWGKVYYSVYPDTMNFSDASEETYRVVTASIYSGTILPMSSRHQNATYTLTFPGPRLRCEYVGDYVALDGLDEIPSENVLYNAEADDYNATMWVYTPTRNFTCQTWNVTYTAAFSFINGIQTVEVLDHRYDHAVIQDPAFLENQTSSTDPPETYVYVGWFRAMTQMFRGFVIEPVEIASETSGISAWMLQSKIAGCPELKEASLAAHAWRRACPEENLERAMEVLSENMTLSFFASVPNLYKGYNGDIDADDEIDADMTTTTANVTISRTRIQYAYNHRTLLLSYTPAVFVTLLIALTGLYAVRSNGMTHSSSFSGILCTTRNPDLDAIVQGNHLGARPLGRSLARQKLQFGLLQARGGGEVKEAHAAFGLEGSVIRLRKKRS